MSRPVCHSCVGMPRAVTCVICDRTVDELKAIIAQEGRHFDAAYSTGVELNTKLKNAQAEVKRLENELLIAQAVRSI